MGKRKTAKKPMAKKRQGGMPTTFACLFCNMDDTVTVKLDKKAGIGELVCKNCDQRYQHRITSVSEPYDVWYEWQDAADFVAQETAAGGLESMPASRAPAQSSISTASKRRDDDDDELEGTAQDCYEDDGFIERDDEDAEADYA